MFVYMIEGKTEWATLIKTTGLYVFSCWLKNGKPQDCYKKKVTPFFFSDAGGLIVC